MLQHEITRRRPLLDSKGNIAEPGFARRLLPVYSRKDIRAGALRVKEWDYYLINNGRFALALTVADNGYMGLDSISFIDLENLWQQTSSPISLLPLGRRHMPASSAAGDVAVKSRDYSISFRHIVGGRMLSFEMKSFSGSLPISGEISLSDEPEESIVMCTPFRKGAHFYFNQKINCMRASGSVYVRGRHYSFDPADSFAVLDWGRGVWTYSNTWYWGSASGELDGVPFGFNIGCGFGDTSAATENCLFYGGRLHKLSRVSFNIPRRAGEYSYMSPWTFTSDDGRFEMDFRPVLDRSADMDVKLLRSEQHQVFGLFSGTAVLDNGVKLRLRDFPGFAERVANKW